MTIYEEIIKKSEALAPELTALRRDFHSHAEAGWYEIRTSSIIARRLTELGYQVLTGPDVCRGDSRMGLPDERELDTQYSRALEQGAIQPWAERAKDGYTGVIGILDCGDGPVIAMRFDIDALGVVEDKSDSHRPYHEGFCSKNDGMMHACGHDGHAAIGLGTADVLMGIKDKLHGKIKLIFQPSEEGVRGAKSIVENGHLDDCDYVIANHMGDSFEGFDIGMTNDGNLATSKLDIIFKGKATHAGSDPDKGNNAMLSAATAVLNLHAIPRSAMGETRINVGTLHAGTGRNVICDRAKLELEVRGSNTETNAFVEGYARRIIKAAAEMHGCGYEIKLAGAAEAFVSDLPLMDRCGRVCRDKLGLSATADMHGSSGSEDFAYMVNRVRSHGGEGLFFRTLTPCAGPFHGTNFDFDESAMPNAIKVFCGMACDIMGI